MDRKDLEAGGAFQGTQEPQGAPASEALHAGSALAASTNLYVVRRDDGTPVDHSEQLCVRDIEAGR